MQSHKTFIVIIFIIGVVIITKEVTKRTFKCPKQKTVVKWIPNPNQINFQDYNRINEIFGSMFQKSEPWIGTENIQSNKFRKIVKEQKNNNFSF